MFLRIVILICRYFVEETILPFVLNDRLMENFVEVTRRRVALWFPAVTMPVQRVEETVIEVLFDGYAARLCFDPRQCRWELQTEEERSSGSFDRVTKRLRQLLTKRPSLGL